MNGSKVTDLVSIYGDEYFTHEKHIRDIAENLNGTFKVWCPFNDNKGLFPGILREYGHEVVATDGDFFETDVPEGCAAIISNPPFSRKKDVLKRIDQLGLKYALILPYMFLNDGVPLDYGHQIILWRKRMYFLLDGVAQKKPRTNCFVLSNGILKKDLTIIK